MLGNPAGHVPGHHGSCWLRVQQALWFTVVAAGLHAAVAAAAPCDASTAGQGYILVQGSCVWPGLEKLAGASLTISGPAGLDPDSVGGASLPVITAGASLTGSSGEPTAGLSVRIERLVLVGFSIGSTSAPLWPQELAGSTPSNISLADVRILLPKEQMASWIQFLTGQGTPPSTQTDGSTWVYIARYSSPGVELQSVSLHAEDCAHPGDLLPSVAPGLPASSGTSAAAAAKQVSAGAEPCLVQVNNASLVPTLLAYAGQRTSVPLLVYINSNVTLASVDDVAPYGIPVNRPLILAGLASVNTSMDFGMVVEQLNASQANSSSVTFQSLVLENLAPGGEATSRASGPFSVLIQNNLFAVYFDRSGPVRVIINDCIVVVEPKELDYITYMGALFASPLPYLRQQTEFLRTDIGTTEWISRPGATGDSLFIVALTGTRARAWYDTMFVNSAVIAPPLPLPATAAGTLLPNKPSPVVHSVRSPMEIRESLEQRGKSPPDRTYVVMVSANVTLPAGGSWAPNHTTTVAAPLQLIGQDSDTFLDFGYTVHQISLPDAAAAGWLSFSQMTLRGLPQSTSSSRRAGDRRRLQHIQSSSSSSGRTSALRRRLHRRLLQAAGSNSAEPPTEYTILLWSIGRTMDVEPSLTLTGTTLLLPAPELELFRAQARENSAFVLQLQGTSLGISVQGASVESNGQVHLLSLTGPGLSGDNITLGLDPTGTSQQGYSWTGGVPVPSSSHRGRGVLVPWQLALAIVLPVVGLLAAAGGAWWWLGRHRRCAAGAVCKVCRLDPCRCPGTDSSKSVLGCSKGGASGGNSAAAAAAGDLAGLDGVRGRDQTHSTEGGVAVVSTTSAPPLSGTSRADRKATYIANSLQNWKAAVSNTTMAIMQRRLDTGLDAAIASGSGSGQGLPSPMVPPRRRGTLGGGAEADHEGGEAGGGATAASAGSSGGIPAQPQQQPKLVELIGVGGFGSVYKGVWMGKHVAVKVMQLPANALLTDPSQSSFGPAAAAAAAVGMRAVAAAGQVHKCKGQSSHQMAIMEAVVSNTMCHPNVVQVFTYFLDPLAVANSASTSAPTNNTNTPPSPEEDSPPLAGGDSSPASDGLGMEDGPTAEPEVTGWSLKVVMEYCNQGCLREALDRRLLCPEGSSRPAPEAVLSIAHDIASALLHLHCEGIVHGDIKAANILLSCPGETARSGRSVRQDPRVSMLDLHIIAKVADFGLALILGPSDTHATQHSRGTPTHMSPELFMAGHVSKASDVYAFGILLWETMTGQRAFAGVPIPLLPHEVAREGLRPTWPTTLVRQCPAYPQLQRLAEACWAGNPVDRPSFQAILPQLEELMMATGCMEPGLASAPMMGSNPITNPAALALYNQHLQHQALLQAQQRRLMGPLGGPPVAPGVHPALQQPPRVNVHLHLLQPVQGQQQQQQQQHHLHVLQHPQQQPRPQPQQHHLWHHLATQHEGDEQEGHSTAQHAGEPSAAADMSKQQQQPEQQQEQQQQDKDKADGAALSMNEGVSATSSGGIAKAGDMSWSLAS